MFAHALTGCDATSALKNFRKTFIFKKLRDSIALTNIGDVFYEEFKTHEEIDNACIHFFEEMFLLSDQMPQTRKRRYDEMDRKDRARINSSKNPDLI